MISDTDELGNASAPIKTRFSHPVELVGAMRGSMCSSKPHGRYSTSAELNTPSTRR